ncbi:MAG: HU family DNA-binding protein [Phocaeicola sp.]
MAIQFDFYPNPNATEQEMQYHPRVINKAPLENEEILQLINQRCSLTDSDVIACLTELRHIIEEGLHNGRTVHLSGIGSFSLSLNCTSEQVSPHTRAEHVRFKSVIFKADNQLKRGLSTLQLERAAQKKHSALLTDQEVEQRIAHHFTTNPTLTRSQVEKLCQFTRSKALRHINRLLTEGKLVNLGSRYQAIYARG